MITMAASQPMGRRVVSGPEPPPKPPIKPDPDLRNPVEKGGPRSVPLPRPLKE